MRIGRINFNGVYKNPVESGLPIDIPIGTEIKIKKGEKTIFKIGDVVRLKSGGPCMTVVQINKEIEHRYTTHWFYNGEIKCATWSEECLILDKDILVQEIRKPNKDTKGPGGRTIKGKDKN